MAVKKYKPITPGSRHHVGNTFSEITASKPEKSLTVGLRKKGGRNSSGKMTIRNVGGGHKRRYRIIDFKRNKEGIPGKVKTIEYDPNRSAFIALIVYADGEKRYIVAPSELKPIATRSDGRGRNSHRRSDRGLVHVGLIL